MVCEYNAKRFCCEPIENIENYEAAMADKTQTWDCHHKLEIQGQFTNSVKLLKKCGMYFNVPANELIFLTHSNHRKLHTMGKSCSEETRKRMSEAHKGNANAKGKKRSEETRKKMSEARKGRSKGSVRMTSLSSGEVKDFYSLCEAERWLRSHGFPKANRSSIWFCCHKQRNAKIAYGATWKFADSAK